MVIVVRIPVKNFISLESMAHFHTNQSLLFKEKIMQLSNQEFCQKYLIDRKNTNSVKWDLLEEKFGDSDLLSMWVADMEFRTADEVIDALTQRVAHGVFGYTLVPDTYYPAAAGWYQRNSGYSPDKEWFRFANGVVVSIYWLIQCFTKPDDGVLILTPVYYPFHNAVNDNGRRLVRSELVRDAEGRYSIDLADFEKKIVENDVKLFIHCSPHNPVGRVWTEAELNAVFAICQKHHVLVISDEIHQDIMIDNHRFLSAAAVENGQYLDNLIILNSASKTFNLACLICSHILIPNKALRERYDAYVKTVNQISTNVLGITATQAAYEYGEDWKNSLLSVISENYHTFRSTLLAACPKLIISPLEGTYLAWVDIRAYVKPEDTKAFIQDQCKIAADYGEWFSDQCQGFLRFNLATDPRFVQDACKRMIACLTK